MATDDETQPPAATPPAGGTPYDGLIQGLLAQASQDPMAAYQQYLRQQQQNAPPVSRSWSSLLGSALGGGQGAVTLTPQQQETEGNRALLNFGLQMLQASGPSPVRHGAGQIFAQGLQGAGEAAGTYEGQINALQQQGFKNAGELQNMRMSALKEVLPLLQLQTRLNMPSLYGGGGASGGPVAGAATGAPIGGGGAPGGIQFTGDPAKDLPAVKAHESSGDYGAMNYVAKADPSAWDRGATATGAYQMVQSTWDAGKRLAGIDPGQYPRAMDAPPDVQDKVAAAVYGKFGSAPWDPSTWKSNWVQGSGGKYTLQANAPYTGPLPKAPPGAAPSPLFIGGTRTAPAATPTPPAATTGADDTFFPTAPPGATTAPATTDLVGPRTLPPVTSRSPVVTPAQIANTPVPAPPPGAVPATTTPPVVPAPQVTTQQPTPAPTPAVTTPTPPGPLSKNPDGTFTIPDEKLPSVLDYQARYRHVPSPAEMQQFGLVLPDNPQALQTAYAGVQEAEREAAAAHTAADSIMRTGIGGTDASRAIEAANTADKNAAGARNAYTTLIQGANEKNAAALQSYYDKQNETLAGAYKAQVTDPRAAATLAQTELAKAKVAAGYTAEQHQVDAEQTAGNDQLKAMGTAAEKAEAIQPMLQQLIPLLRDPKAPAGAVGQFLSSHQEFLPALTAMGITDPKTASITQLVNGLTDYLTLDLKPTATGAMRIQEIPMLKGLMPSLATDSATQQQALARILNYTQRVKDEYDFANEHFGDAKVGPDGNPVMMSSGVARPDYRIMYKNIDAPMQLDENGRRTGGGLGSVVPTPPQLSSNPTASEVKAMTSYNRYVQNLAPGMPYNIYEQQPDGSLQLKMKIHN